MSSKFTRYLDRAISAVTTIVLIAMMIQVLTHALGRFFFSAPLYGTNELVTFWYLPFIALLGIPAAQIQKQQIVVTLAVDRMARRNAAIYKVFASALGALLSVGFAYFGLEEALESMSKNSTAGVTDIITWPAYFLVPIVFTVLGILYVIEIPATLAGQPESEPLQVNIS